jgi:hypothetical protein
MVATLGDLDRQAAKALGRFDIDAWERIRDERAQLTGGAPVGGYFTPDLNRDRSPSRMLAPAGQRPDYLCWHESGHAVVACLLGLRSRSATIYADGGEVHYGSGDISDYQMAVITAAGGEAELRLGLIPGRVVFGDRDDRRSDAYHIAKLVRELNLSVHDDHGVYCEAARLVARYWNAVEVVGRHLRDFGVADESTLKQLIGGLFGRESWQPGLQW